MKLRIGKLLSGYRPDCKQYHVALVTELPALGYFDIAAANAFLSEKLEVSYKDSVLFRIGRKGRNVKPLKQLISTGVAISQHALELASFPSFAPTVAARVQDLGNDTDNIELPLLAPTVSYADQDTLSEGYALGFRIAQLFLQPEKNRDLLQELVEKDLYNFITSKSQSHGGFSGKFILRAAFDHGVPFLSRGNGLFQLGFGEKQYLFDRSAIFTDSAVGAQLSNNKAHAIQHMSRAGIPVPRSVLLDSSRAAKRVAESIGYPVVVKPVDMDRGEGVTVDIETPDALSDAVRHAQQFSPRFLIEERIPGICHRILVFQGKVIFAYARHPQAVQGNGTASISELVVNLRKKSAMKARHLQGKPPVLDAEAMNVIATQSKSPETVLRDCELVFLRRSYSPDDGGFEQIVTDTLHPENVYLAERVARLFGLQIAGVDLITSDASRPWYETNSVINEVNFKPQVGRHTADQIIRICFPGDGGQIPIECFIGGEAAMSAALKRQADLGGSGIQAYLTSHKETYAPDGRTMRLQGFNSVFERVECLLTDPQAAAIIVVLQTDEFLWTGLPFPKASNVKIIDDDIGFKQTRSVRSAANAALQLEHLLLQTGA